jgi:Homeodomain-like domain-containing protein
VCIIKIELQTKFNLIHEKESTGGDTVTDICARYNTSTKTYYKWKNRYLKDGIEMVYRIEVENHTQYSICKGNK